MGKRSIVQTSQAPAAIGPYSQGVVAEGRLVFTAGQIAIDPTTGAMVGESVSEQTRQVLRNLRAVLEATGSSLQRVVKTTVFLRNMEDFAAMNEVYAEFFDYDPPARAAVEVARLPKNALVEIEAVALVR